MGRVQRTIGPAPRLEFIDTMRGFACLWVVLYHAFLEWQSLGGKASPNHPLTAFLQSGGRGVDIFLVLSGFCLFYPIVRQSDVQDVHVDPGSFFPRRARRILPPYYVALACFALLNMSPMLRELFAAPGTRSEVLTIDLPVHLLMLHNLHPRTFFSINGSFWSLALECQLYMLFPLLLLLIRRLSLPVVAVLSILISQLWWQGASAFVSPNAPPALFSTVYFALPARLSEFVAGMVAAAVLTRRLPLPWTVSLVTALLCAVALQGGRSLTGVNQCIFWGGLSASSLLLLDRLDHRFPTCLRVLRPLTWFGTISYSVYLLHGPLIRLTHLLGELRPFALRFPAVALLLLIPAITAISVLFYRLFEYPFTRPVPVRLPRETSPTR